MSLTQKISEEMAALAYRIIARSEKGDDDKTKKLVQEYRILERCLKKTVELKAEGVEC